MDIFIGFLVMRSAHIYFVYFLKWTLALLPAVVIFPQTISAQDISGGLVLHYSFENISGDVVTDLSGNANHGSLQGNAAAADGFEGQGVQCLIKPDYIAAPDHLNAGLSSFTFTAWVKLNALKGGTRFFDWGTGTDGTNNFIAFIPSYDGDNGYMNLRFRSASGTAYNVFSDARCPVGEWAHVAVTYAWNGSSGFATIYLNGKATGTKADIPYDPDTFLGTGTDNFFGHSRWTQDIYGFNGTFDDIRVYNRALNEEEVVTVSGLNAIYEEYALLDPGDLLSVTNDLDLVIQGSVHPEVQISWTSSQHLLIEENGTVHRPNFFDYPVTLTATLQMGKFSMEKIFQATVLAKEGTAYTGDLLLRYDFSNLEGDVVMDVAEKQFSGSLKNSAKVVTIGTAGTGTYNVLHTGADNGYFDMGPQAGLVLARLENFTISAYFRIDPGNEDPSLQGNSLWTFSNSENAFSGRDGYFSSGLGTLGISITPGYNTKASGLQTVAFGRHAFTGQWHHFAYTQRGNVGTIYIDGAAMASGEVTQTPFSSLVTDGSLGTGFNWIGRPPIYGMPYLENTLIWDLRLYSRGLSAIEISDRVLDVMQTLPSLERATEAYLGDSRSTETAPPELKHHPAPTYMEITNQQHFSSRIDLGNVQKITFSGEDTNIGITSGGSRSFATDNILHIVFGPRETGTHDRPGARNMELYPNPSADRVFIRSADDGEENIRIISLSGTVVRTVEMKVPQIEIDISDLPPGLYIIERGIHSLKLLKQ